MLCNPTERTTTAFAPKLPGTYNAQKGPTPATDAPRTTTLTAFGPSKNQLQNMNALSASSNTAFLTGTSNMYSLAAICAKPRKTKLNIELNYLSKKIYLPTFSLRPGVSD